MSVKTNAQDTAASSNVVAGSATGPLAVVANSGTATLATYLLQVAAATNDKADLELTSSKVTPATPEHDVTVAFTVANRGPSTTTKVATLIGIPKGTQIINPDAGCSRLHWHRLVT